MAAEVVANQVVDVETLEQIADSIGMEQKAFAAVYLHSPAVHALVHIHAAALEDRERLRDALKRLVGHVFDSDTEFEAALNQARAALEGRDG